MNVPLSRGGFALRAGLVLAAWLAIQFFWWFLWLVAQETCTTLAAKATVERVVAEGLYPSLILAAMSASLLGYLYVLVARRRSGPGLSLRPLKIAAGLYLAQLAVNLLGEHFLYAGCPADPRLAPNANAEIIGPLFGLWWLMTLACLGLAIYLLVSCLRPRPA